MQCFHTKQRPKRVISYGTVAFCHWYILYTYDTFELSLAHLTIYMQQLLHFIRMREHAQFEERDTI